MLVHKITDAHVHLRSGFMVADVAPFSAARCDHIIAMPNLPIPVHSASNISHYQNHCQEELGSLCEVHLAAMLLESTTPKDVEAAKRAGAIGYKIYPAGATTNSHNGIPESLLLNWTPEFRDTISAIHDNDLVLMHHGELPSSEVLKREEHYCWEVFQKFLRRGRLKTLRQTFEHVTTEYVVETIKTFYDNGWNIRGTITLHHLETTLTDVVGDKLRPDLFCKPIPKLEQDRLALIKAIKHPAFMFGSDSAPHKSIDKYCSHGCAGVFTAPVMLEQLYAFMEEQDLLKFWDDFTWRRANSFYGFEDLNQFVELVEEPWTMPDMIAGITPYKAGETIKYRIK